MSAPTLDRPTRPEAPAPTRRAPEPVAAARGHGGALSAVLGARSPAGRTTRTWAGLALGLTPLFMLVTDSRWYVVGIGATVVAVAPAWALRWWGRDAPARVWQLLPGVVLLPFYLTAACVPTGAWGGVVPTRVTWTALGLLHDELVRTIATGTAPIVSTPGVRLGLAVLLGLGAVMVDILSTVLEAPSMVGLVLLPVYVLSGATVREPVTWWWFVFAAAGYLLLLSTTGAAARPWGREIGRRPDGAAPSLVSGKRIATITVLAATVLPMLAVGDAHNPVADALHRSGTGGSGGSGGTGSITALASLKGTLLLKNPVDLLTVKVPARNPVEPFYLRQSVLDLFTGDGWIPANAEDGGSVRTRGLTLDPVRPAGVANYGFRADVAVSGLNGRPVVFADTTGTTGLPRGTAWDPAHGTVDSSTVARGARYSLTVSQPNPTEAQLATTTFDVPAAVPALLRAVPRGIDPSVAALTQQVVGGATTSPYAVAKALTTWFTDPANGFQYSLDVPAGDSGNALVDFLRNKKGFCQQYAAAMAVMLRLAGVPSRVVVGYTHVSPDSSGTFTVTSRDAHAWVEAYLGGVGWTSFDPTPLRGGDAARQVLPPWLATAAPTVANGAVGAITGSASTSAANNRAQQDLAANQAAAAAAAAARRAPDHTGAWAALASALGVVVLVLLGPALRRAYVRRRRRRTGGAGAAEARFAELQDTCTDLGLPWSPARSPRAVAAWLADLGVARSTTAPLVTAVERSRYARLTPAASGDGPGAGVDAALDATVRALRRRAGTVPRLRARWWPRSVVAATLRTARTRIAALREAFAGWSARRPRPRGVGRNRLEGSR